MFHGPTPLHLGVRPYPPPVDRSNPFSDVEETTGKCLLGVRITTPLHFSKPFLTLLEDVCQFSLSTVHLFLRFRYQ